MMSPFDKAPPLDASSFLLPPVMIRFHSGRGKSRDFGPFEQINFDATIISGGDMKRETIARLCRAPDSQIVVNLWELMDGTRHTHCYIYATGKTWSQHDAEQKAKEAQK